MTTMFGGLDCTGVLDAAVDKPAHAQKMAVKPNRVNLVIVALSRMGV
jgi:hypothetical protein